MKTNIKSIIAVIALMLSAITYSNAQFPWPIRPTNAIHRIWGGYGEYDNYTAGEYFHEALDLIDTMGKAVIAVKTGLIVEKWTGGSQNNSVRLGLNDTLRTINGVNRSFWYLHITI